MRLFNHVFKDDISLEKFILENIDSSKAILIQLFCGMNDFKRIENLLNVLDKTLPNAKVIGTSTAGEIVNGKIHREQINISFSVFEKTSIETYYYEKSDYETGIIAAKEVITSDTKASIIFAESLKGDSESFLEGFSSVSSDSVIAGGNAGDNNVFKETFIIKDKKIYFEGLVIATLNSKTLHVSTNYTLAWTPIGKDMTVTKADKNIIYEIDNKPIEELYVHYLGNETVENLPSSAMEFPLLKKGNGVNIARSILAKADNGFVYAGHFKEGDVVRFAIGNIEEVINEAPKLQDSIVKKPVEASYIYSCSVRDSFIREELNYEFSLIEEIAPSAGFFTYGEFYHQNKNNQLLNITTTTISLSESDEVPDFKSKLATDVKSNMLKSLTHLVNQTQNELDESLNFLNQYKFVLDESAIVSKTDINGIITYVNEHFCEISGYSKEELIGKNHNILKHPDEPISTYESLWKTILDKKIWHGKLKNISKDGNTYYVKSVIAPILDDNNEISEFIASRIDVTELVEKDKIIKEQFIDELTSLNNRVSLFHRLRNSSQKHTLLLINIDRFSDINHYFGYSAGDDLLKLFAQKLKTEMSNGDVFRISGDEFAVICDSENNSYEEIQENIIKRISILEKSKFKIKNIEISLIFSCGVAYSENKDLYRLAHLALKESENQNKKIVFFSDDNLLNDKTKNNIDTISKIKEAIDDDRIVPYFQGIVDNSTGKITKYESLIRMIDVDGKVISPFFFLEHAKKAKLYDQLTQIMIRKSFEVFHDKDYEFSINLTMQDISSNETKELLKSSLDKYGCGERLVLEIVESEGIENFEQVISFINEVKSMNCKIAIDDFGSGYSNFAYLTKLNVDFVKIDGSLIKEIDTDSNKKAIVQSILFFAKSLGMKTIAEFVENESIYNILKEMGVDFSQGYFFSIPSENL